MGYVDTDPRPSRNGGFDRGTGKRTPEELEALSHEELMERLGYLPRQAEIRIRRAQPPKLGGDGGK